MLVAGEAMLGACRHEDRLTLRKRVRGILDLERAVTLQDDVDLVVLVWLLAVRLRRGEDIHTDLEPGALVDDFVAAARSLQAPLRIVHAERVGTHGETLRLSPDAAQRVRGHSARMSPASYAMFWWIDGGPRRAGRIELDDDFVELSATTPSAAVDRIGFRELASILLEGGVLHLGRGGKPLLHIGSLDTPGALRELADRLTSAAA